MIDDFDVGDLADLEDLGDLDGADLEAPEGDLGDAATGALDPELGEAVAAAPLPDPHAGEDLPADQVHFGGYRYDIEGAQSPSGQGVGGDAAGHLYDKGTGEELDRY